MILPGVEPPSTEPPGPLPAGADVVFVGSMSYVPNVDAVTFFARDVLPLITAAVPGATFTIVGARPSPAVRALASLPGVRVTGAVDDVNPFYAAAAVAVVPLRMAGGVRMKILEALGLGAAIVSTTIGAEGLDLESGADLVIADTPEQLAEAVIGLLRDPALRERLGRHARETAARRFSWARVAAELRTGLRFRGDQDGMMEALNRQDDREAPASRWILLTGPLGALLLLLLTRMSKIALYLDTVDHSGLIYVLPFAAAAAMLVIIRYPRLSLHLLAIMLPFNFVGGYFENSYVPDRGEDQRGHVVGRGSSQHQHRAGRESRVDDADGPRPVGAAVARLRDDGRRDRCSSATTSGTGCASRDG